MSVLQWNTGNWTVQCHLQIVNSFLPSKATKGSLLIKKKLNLSFKIKHIFLALKNIFPLFSWFYRNKIIPATRGDSVKIQNHQIRPSAISTQLWLSDHRVAFHPSKLQSQW